MKNSIGFIFRIIVLLAVSLGCGVLSTPVPSTEIPSLISPTFTPEPITLTPIPLPLSISFEDGILSGLGIFAGEWGIVEDGTGNHVFQNDSQEDWPGFSIGSSISDGIIEFRFQYLEYDTLIDSGSGRVNLSFRSNATSESNAETTDGYIFSLNPFVQRTEIAINTNGIWSPPLLNSMSTIVFQKNVWYSIRVELRGQSIIAYVNGTPVSQVSDNTFQTGEVLIGIGPDTKVRFDDISIVYELP